MRVSPLCLLLALLSCAQPSTDEQPPKPEPAMAPDTIPQLSLPQFDGWIACGGSLTLGGSATASDAYPAILLQLPDVDSPLLNAAIAGETLAGLLQRLPVLLSRQPQGLILELGQEDERAQTPMADFQQQLGQLEQLPAAEIRLIIIGTAKSADYIRTIKAFAQQRQASLLDGRSLLDTAATPQAHLALAQQIKPLMKP